MEIFEQCGGEVTYPRIVIPIIGPCDSDEGAYASFPKGHNVVGASSALRLHRCRRSK